MGITHFACRACQHRLAAYIRHELPAHERRSVAAHLDSCAVCYGVYLQQQSVMQDLTFHLPRYGQPTRPTLDRVWAAVQAEMRQPVPPGMYAVRTSIVTVAILLLFFIPMALGGRGRTVIAAAAPTQPAPLVQRATPANTPVGATPTTVAFYVTLAPSRQTTGPAPDVFNTP